MKWYLMALKKYTVFTGRSRRKEFWMFALFNIIFGAVARILDAILGLDFSSYDSKLNGGFISSLYNLFVLIPALALTVRRFHDIGKSGWVYFRFMLIAFLATIFYVGYLIVLVIQNGEFDESIFTGNVIITTLLFVLFILGICVWLLILMVREGTPGDNKYGPNPKEIAHAAVVQEEQGI